MAGPSFRFLQAGSFRLHAALQGLSGVPESLTELLTDAPYRSAAEVFQAALHEAVDFVVLTGDILDPTAAGPPAVAFLQQQFQQLQLHDIAVYWAASRMDQTADWLDLFEWPANVRIFSSDELDEFVHHKGDDSVARIVGRSWHPQRPLRAAEFEGLSGSPFSIAALHTHPDLEQHRAAVPYWALAGTTASTPLRSDGYAHCAGSPQGLSLAECGAHGCSLVQVSAEGEVHARMVETDAVRWCHEALGVTNSVSRSEIRSTLKTRATSLRESVKRPLLVQWTITGEDRFDTLLADEPSRIELLDWLRQQFGDGTPAAWSIALELEAAETLPTQWVEEDSILGDFLRVVGRYQEDSSESLNLDQFVAGRELPNELAEAITVTDGAIRNQVLREAAILGADLLRGDESELGR